MVETQNSQSPENPAKQFKSHTVLRNLNGARMTARAPEGDNFLLERSKGPMHGSVLGQRPWNVVLSQVHTGIV